MKHFDLEAAKRGEAVEWHDARVERWKGCHFVGMTRTNMIVVEDDIGVIWNLPRNSIRMAPKKRTVWVNIYRSGASSAFGGAYWHTSEAQAKAHGEGDRVGGHAWPLEIEE